MSGFPAAARYEKHQTIGLQTAPSPELRQRSTQAISRENQGLNYRYSWEKRPFKARNREQRDLAKASHMLHSEKHRQKWKALHQILFLYALS